MLEYDKNIRLLGEMKPNEPMDLMYLPTTGHFLAMAYKSRDPNRVGVLIESAHAILAGLDPSDEFAYALFHKKLWGVHLNDQNGLKYDQDKAFGAVDLRRAFNQVDTLVRHGYGKAGEVVGLDVKAMRTQPADKAFLHLKHSKEIFLDLVDLAHRIDRKTWQGYVDARDYEGLERFIVRELDGQAIIKSDPTPSCRGQSFARRRISRLEARTHSLRTCREQNRVKAVIRHRILSVT